MYTMNKSEIKFIQRLLGTVADGYVGSKTIAKAEHRVKGLYGLRAFIGYAQMIANNLGNSLKVDGYWGPNTEAVIRKMMGRYLPTRIDVEPKKRKRVYRGSRQVRNFQPSAKGRRLNNAFPKHKNKDMNAFFGRIGTNHTRMKFPYPMYYGRNPVKSTMVNRNCADNFHDMLLDTYKHYGAKRIGEMRLDRYNGCFNDRNVRNGRRKSTHAWAVAMDFAAANNRLHWKKDRALFAKDQYDAFWEIVYDNGLLSLGMEYNMDFMHIQATRLDG